VTGKADVTVDVGLTAYRRATYIQEAIDSVLAQTFERWQLTICDNGEEDCGLERIVGHYLSDPRVTYTRTGRELSAAENWTNALNQGAGPYVAVLNDDDRWHPEYLEARVDALEQHRECGFAFSAWIQIDEHGREMSRAPARFPEGVISRENLAYWFMRENLVVPPAIVLRRSACESVGPYFDGNWQYMDWELWARLAARFPAFYLACHDSDFRRHPTTVTRAERESPGRLLAMLDHLEDLFAGEVGTSRLTRVERGRTRSRILLRAASDVHGSGGWRMSGPTYRRALREYPPTVFSRVSLTMLAKTLLGKRGSRAVARTLRAVGLRRDPTTSATT
jgi:glycosyltransferase involved in cell wall biosynthesis